MVVDTRVTRATRWLERHRLGTIEPSELLVARLDARRHGALVNGFLVAAAMLAMIGWSFFDQRTDNVAAATDVADVAQVAGISGAFILALGVGLWQQYRIERRLLSTVRTRSAHPVAPRVARVLGPVHLAATIVTYAGGLLLGVVAVESVTQATDRALAVTFLVAVAALGGLGALVLAAGLRRPSVAQDAESLLVDDVLRTQGARAAVAPYPIAIAVIMVINGGVDPWMFWSFLGYAAIAGATALLAEAVDDHH